MQFALINLKAFDSSIILLENIEHYCLYMMCSKPFFLKIIICKIQLYEFCNLISLKYEEILCGIWRIYHSGICKVKNYFTFLKKNNAPHLRCAYMSDVLLLVWGIVKMLIPYFYVIHCITVQCLLLVNAIIVR